MMEALSKIPLSDLKVKGDIHKEAPEKLIVVVTQVKEANHAIKPYKKI